MTETSGANMASPMLEVSVVVIGRNEGPRLGRCLQSVKEANWAGLTHELIYVDSQSTDDSVAMASQMGAQALELDEGKPCAEIGRAHV